MRKPRLVILHRNMGLLGGAQRDLIVALPEHAKRWSITVATLNAPQLLLDRVNNSVSMSSLQMFHGNNPVANG